MEEIDDGSSPDGTSYHCPVHSLEIECIWHAGAHGHMAHPGHATHGHGHGVSSVGSIDETCDVYPSRSLTVLVPRGRIKSIVVNGKQEEKVTIVTETEKVTLAVTKQEEIESKIGK